MPEVMIFLGRKLERNKESVWLKSLLDVHLDNPHT